MQHPDFKHRSMVDGDSYEDYNIVDLHAFMDNRINHVLDTMYLIGQQYQEHSEVMLSDNTNLNTLNEIKLGILDIKTMFDWFISNHEIVRVETDESDELVDLDGHAELH